MNASKQRVSEAMRDVGQSPEPATAHETKDPTPDAPKKRTPVASPEFAEARLRRDIRIRVEQKVKLSNVYARKVDKLDAELSKLNAELASVQSVLAKGNGQ